MVKKKKIIYSKKKKITDKKFKLNLSWTFIFVALALVIICGSLLVSENYYSKKALSLSPTITIDEENGPYFISLDDAIKGTGNSAEKTGGIIDDAKKKIAGVMTAQEMGLLFVRWGWAGLIASFFYAIFSFLIFLGTLGLTGNKVLKKKKDSRIWLLRAILGNRKVSFLENNKRSKKVRLLQLFGWFLLGPIVISFFTSFILSVIGGIGWIAWTAKAIDFLSIDTLTRAVALFIYMIPVSFAYNMTIGKGIDFLIYRWEELFATIEEKQEEAVENAAEDAGRGAKVAVSMGKGVKEQEMNGEF